MHSFHQQYVENIFWFGKKALRRIWVGPKSHFGFQTVVQGLLQSLSGLCKFSLIWLVFRYTGPPIKYGIYNRVYLGSEPTVRGTGELACWNAQMGILIYKIINVFVWVYLIKNCAHCIWGDWRVFVWLVFLM